MRLPGKPVACTVTKVGGGTRATVTGRKFRLLNGWILLQPYVSPLTLQEEGSDAGQHRLVFIDDPGSSGDWEIAVNDYLITPDGPANGYPIVEVRPYPGSHIELIVRVKA